MRQWLEKPLGKYYLALAKAKMAKILAQSFGYHLLIIGEPGLADCVVSSPINHHVLLHHAYDSQRNIYSLCCGRQDRLPIASESIDLVYLAHCLEIYHNPEEILQEAYRVLRPEGRIIISGFTSVSSLALLAVLGRLLRITSWRTKFITAMRARYQLLLLGFSHVEIERFFYFIPALIADLLPGKPRFYERFASKFKLPFASAYLIMATKRVITLTPIKPAWQSQRSLLADTLIETATQQYKNDAT